MQRHSNLAGRLRQQVEQARDKGPGRSGIIVSPLLAVRLLDQVSMGLPSWALRRRLRRSSIRVRIEYVEIDALVPGCFLSLLWDGKSKGWGIS
ncbi:hypothetical protein XA68_17862 [Ophiocordyceps unilateralis]|uniref:Uncharacterized protein n=1 Tax=Ophiocordyceps unilateralis TaxID=268505 RepID=A0A2A9P436_OPHUN|nr:hypothetical protein XA68_17862 [Ophiocordyceps unilateralis]